MYIHMAVSKKNRVKITWSIDADLIKEVKHRAIDMDMDASSIVERAIKEWLGKEQNKTSLAAKKAWETRRRNSENITV